MRKLIVILPVVVCMLFSAAIQAENNSSSVWLFSHKKNNAYAVEIKNHKAYVFRLAYHVRKDSYYILDYADTLTETSSSTKFQGATSSLQVNSTKSALIIKDASGKTTHVEIKADTSHTYTNSAICEGIWYLEFMHIVTKLGKTYPLFQSSVWDGYHYWRDFENKNMHYSDFQSFAQQEAAKIYDSLVLVNTHLAVIASPVLNNLDSATCADLKTALSQLPQEPYYAGGYYNGLVQTVCIHKPDLFFQLAEEMPEIRENLFNIAKQDRNSVNSLKNADSKSPIKKKFLRYNRREKTRMIVVGTAVTTGILAVYGGLVYLIVRAF